MGSGLHWLPLPGGEGWGNCDHRARARGPNGRSPQPRARARSKRSGEIATALGTPPSAALSRELTAHGVVAVSFSAFCQASGVLFCAGDDERFFGSTKRQRVVDRGGERRTTRWRFVLQQNAPLLAARSIQPSLSEKRQLPRQKGDRHRGEHAQTASRPPFPPRSQSPFGLRPGSFA